MNNINSNNYSNAIMTVWGIVVSAAVVLGASAGLAFISHKVLQGWGG